MGQPRTTTGAQRVAVALIAVMALLFTVGSFLPPLLIDAGRSAGRWLHLAYAPLCHQMPERSLAVADGVQAVCARCSGLYLGGMIGLWVGLFALSTLRGRLRPALLGWVSLPTLVDALLPWVGLPGLPNLPRLLLALPVGLVLGLYLALGVADLAVRSHATKPPGDTAPGMPLEVLDG